MHGIAALRPLVSILSGFLLKWESNPLVGRVVFIGSYMH